MVYGILSTIAFILILPFWLVLGIFKPKLIYGFKEKMGLYKKDKMCRCVDALHNNELRLHASTPPRFLFYAVSVGEVTAIENLIKKTKETFPEAKLILLTGTKTGQEIANKKLGETCDFISYFPFDFPFCINNMLNKLKPDAIFVAETELWPNFANIVNKKKIPLFIINARISDRTFNSYKKLKFFFAPILRKYTGIYPQSKQDSDKLVSLGANPETTKIMGNLKFDIKKPDISELNFNKNPNDKIILAGSTHTGEEDIILDVFNELKKEGVNGNLKLIIAPRHPGGKYNFNCGYRSKNDNFNNHDILLLDTLGELGKFYSVCDIAFIGGSFAHKSGDNFGGKGVGGHNPLEATIFNKPAVSGPSVHNFKDIYAILTSTNAGKIVKTKEELKEHIRKLLTAESFYQIASQDCEKVFEQNKGALDFVIEVLQKVV